MQPDSVEIVKTCLIAVGFQENLQGIATSVVCFHDTLSNLFPLLGPSLMLSSMRAIVLLASAIKYVDRILMCMCS